ncbi:MAG: flagellar basal body rod protein FlgB [Lachnospiraceae bacterium]|jgi:flagellar basal-body rod protein FlgB|nr:flagellar basal body rod protein FlgB [Lachnospiraceae bacterium]HBV82436.1 flagellar basal body rod protein FlgB [Lachnospiraceae bacterium]
MLNNSGVFDYINVLGTSLDAASTRNDIINHNIANVNTPNYKRKDIRFETELKHAFARATQDSVDARVKNLDLEALTPEIYTDYADLSFRYDGNNVDINNENAILAKNQIKYNGMMELLNKNFSQLKSVTK